jgi:hypothetical protein
MSIHLSHNIQFFNAFNMVRKLPLLFSPHIHTKEFDCNNYILCDNITGIFDLTSSQIIQRITFISNRFPVKKALYIIE